MLGHPYLSTFQATRIHARFCATAYTQIAGRSCDGDHSYHRTATQHALAFTSRRTHKFVDDSPPSIRNVSRRAATTTVVRVFFARVRAGRAFSFNPPSQLRPSNQHQTTSPLQNHMILCSCESPECEGVGTHGILCPPECKLLLSTTTRRARSRRASRHSKTHNSIMVKCGHAHASHIINITASPVMDSFCVNALRVKDRHYRRSLACAINTNCSGSS